MGLSAAQTIIEEIDGWIWAAPKLNGKVLLSFTLPLQDSDVAS
jgi:signal transduction histidine kinase